MAYVVARRNGRFEVRESLHTPRGPRARSLANFAILTDEVLADAARRATRPFDASAVLASGRRAGAPSTEAPSDPTRATQDSSTGSAGFVQASRRMARTLARAPLRGRADPGEELIDLLGFADAVTSSQPRRPFEPLVFPALSKLARHRPVSASAPAPAG
jgi:hypothetical protein